jgi:hypothetical protein
MKLHTKVITATQQQPTIAQASTSMVGMRPDTVLFKFATSEDRQVTLRGCKGLARTKLSLDKDFMPT